LKSHSATQKNIDLEYAVVVESAWSDEAVVGRLLLEIRLGRLRQFSMAETILWYLLLIAIGAGTVFVYAISDNLFDQWHQRRNIRKQAKLQIGGGAFRSAEPDRALNATIDLSTTIRGYDSRDLFWEDALLRIDELKRRIAEDLKKEG
jgi:hypothetical protein